MKIVIDIPEKVYKYFIDEWRETPEILRAVRQGTPLPEHHGRLIDADWVKNTLDIYVINEYNGQFIRRSDVDKIPTIIEESEGE